MSVFEVKDVKGQPSLGRMFPLSFSAIVHECREHHILHHTGARIQIAMRNLNRKGMEESNWLVAELRPKEELTVYSVPDHFENATASVKTLEVIAAFGFLNSHPLKHVSSCVQFFQAYLRDQSHVSLCHVFWHYKQSKYRGNQKFSNAFKKQPLRTELKNIRLADSGIEYTSEGAAETGKRVRRGQTA